MNPIKLLTLKRLLNEFRENHPKVPLFVKAASKTIVEGSIAEVKITNPDGKSLVTNIKLTQNDIEMLKELRELRKS